jgi:Na+-driven multidrug efflux pump
MLCRITNSPPSFEMKFHLFLTKVNFERRRPDTPGHHARTPWYAKRKSYKVLFWREITPLAIPIFLENTCVLLMGVLSTFLVSWLGKEAMAEWGWPTALTWSSCRFSPQLTSEPRLSWHSASASSIKSGRGEAARQSLVIMTLFSIILAAVIHYFGAQIIDFIAGAATRSALALTYLELTVLSYPAAAIALIGSGALRGAGTPEFRC